jgi:hypothetical protein
VDAVGGEVELVAVKQAMAAAGKPKLAAAALVASARATTEKKVLPESGAHSLTTAQSAPMGQASEQARVHVRAGSPHPAALVRSLGVPDQAGR